MKIKKLIIALLTFAGINTAHAMYTRSKGAVLDTKEGWTTYYHVTRQENLESIGKKGLLKFYGGTKQIRGMSALSDNRDYLKESMNHIHFGIPWEAANRYAQHMINLIRENLQTWEEVSKKDMPVILKCDAYKTTFTEDPHDKDAIRAAIDVPVSNIFILVTHSHIDTQGNYTSNEEDQDEKCFWLPLKNWDQLLHKPAYPDEDNKVLKLDEKTIRQLLTKRIELYSRNRLNKGDAASEVGVCSKTLNKFLEQDFSLRLSTKQKIIRNFCRNFSSITRYDQHYIKREIN